MIKIILKDGREFENDPAYGYNLDRVKDIWDCLNSVGVYSLAYKNMKNLNLFDKNIEDVNDIINSTPEKDGDMINIYRQDVKDIIEVK
ncbi:hypothetical protein [Clostridium cylindrosporum]|uniref:Uncharacterized protein n=1 Tax=Clostridium cylindrosporum DSM 605 TaxID=1121307 RepID=A0A0J8D974_CLOCY|nr:hypothetical protein [Clostridium cylindrosporum]KMT20889.1 hypothetical protein CLCY_1c01230 [Clostridium cylindrosporum DSM 605]